MRYDPPETEERSRHILTALGSVQLNSSNGSTVPAGGKDVGRRMIQRGPGKRPINGKDFRLADEVRYIQRRAAEHDGRFVAVASLVLFSTETGDAWLLDPAEGLAARLARDGDPEDLYLEETETRFAIGWKGNYRIERRRVHLYRPRFQRRGDNPRLPYPAPRSARFGNFKYVWLALEPNRNFLGISKLVRMRKGGWYNWKSPAWPGSSVGRAQP